MYGLLKAMTTIPSLYLATGTTSSPMRRMAIFADDVG
jgi:hypothetical protein